MQFVWWSSLHYRPVVVVYTDGVQALQASHSAERRINLFSAYITAELAWKGPVEDEAWIRRSSLYHMKCAGVQAHEGELCSVHPDVPVVAVRNARDVNGPSLLVRAWFYGEHGWEKVASRQGSIRTIHSMQAARP